jgi:MFS family permease
MGAVIAYHPLRKKAGDRMFIAVAIFGIATIVFGVSRNFALSLAALIVAGAADMVSVVIRLTLVQLATPAAMRGRVSAVNMAFINASNELGEFESGVTAALFGTVPAVVIGGAGTLFVVAIWSLLFPELRKLEDLTSAEPPPIPQAQPSSAGSHSAGSPARSAASPSSISPPLPDTAADSPLPAASPSARKPPARSK